MATKTPPAAPTVRLLTDTEDLTTAAALVGTTMLGSVTSEIAEQWARVFADDTTHGAIAPTGEIAGVARWFDTQVSLCGPSLPAAAVTAVAVQSNHRRQGHLRRLMHAQLASVAEANVPLALLVAAEWPIYGRYGYGPAIEACGYELDASTASFIDPSIGSIELVTSAEIRPHLERIHDLRWVDTMGAVTRSAETWDVIAGVSRRPGDTDDAGLVRNALWRDNRGKVQGAVTYRVAEGWTRNRPTGTIEVRFLIGTMPEADRELWRHLCEVDWISTVKAGGRSIDDPLPLWLKDGRAAAKVDQFDCIWARVMNVPTVLGARRATIAGRAVVDVEDELGYANGRWSAEIGPDGAEIKSTSRKPDVRLPVAALSAATLGGQSVARLQRAGWVTEERAGGIARLDALLHTPTAPWSPTTY